MKNTMKELIKGFEEGRYVHAKLDDNAVDIKIKNIGSDELLNIGVRLIVEAAKSIDNASERGKAIAAVVTEIVKRSAPSKG